MAKIKSSKPISDLKKGDKVKIDSMICEVDDSGILMEHKTGGKTVAEMFIDIFDPKTDKDYQIRYFLNNLELSLEVYELQGEFMWVRKDVGCVEW